MNKVNSARLQTYKKLIDDEIKVAVKHGSPSYEIVTEAMEYAVIDGGKRIRGSLILETCRLACGDYQRAIPFALAIEMIHGYSLVHDDLPCMDNDLLRRGKPSTHAKYGEAFALLAGDALLTYAFILLSSGYDKTLIPPQTALKVIELFASCSGINGMIGGQTIDLLCEGKSDVEPKLLYELHAHKTGALIRCSCEVGARLGGLPQDKVDVIVDYANNLGLLFQITDDILDKTSTSEVMGKTIGKDENVGKTTFVTMYGLDEAIKLAQDTAQKAKVQLEKLDGDTSFLCEFVDTILNRKN